MRKTGGDGGDGDICPFQFFYRRFDHFVIDANSTRGEVQIFDIQTFNDIIAQGLFCLGAQAFDPSGSVIAT
jgi:hypothetical protein